MSLNKTLHSIAAKNNLQTGNFITLVELCERKVVELRKSDGKIEYGLFNIPYINFYNIVKLGCSKHETIYVLKD